MEAPKSYVRRASGVAVIALASVVSAAGCASWRHGSAPPAPAADTASPAVETASPAVAPVTPIADAASPAVEHVSPPPERVLAPEPAPAVGAGPEAPAATPATSPTPPEPPLRATNAGGKTAAVSRSSTAAKRTPANPAPAKSSTAATANPAATQADATQADATQADAAKSPAAAPALDLTALEQRLRDTHAIGVFTKLSLKNQVDDLLTAFHAFHGGQIPPALPELRQRYDLLLIKVLSLLQDGDPPLARAISASREAIWGILADREKFQKIQLG